MIDLSGIPVGPTVTTSKQIGQPAKGRRSWVSRAAAYLGKLQDGSYPDGLVIVESPFAGNQRRNRAYLRACLRDSLRRGEFPFASHAIYPQILNDGDPEERALGIRAGLEWGKHADATAVYGDLGISKGMALGIAHATERGRPVVLRYLRGRWGKGMP